MADNSEDHADECIEKDSEIIGETPENGAIDSIISEYEVIFKDRYTESDPTFLESVENIISVPPIVHPWYNKARRNYDYSRDRSGDHHDHHRHHHRRHEHSSSRHGGGYREHRSDRRYHPYHNDRNDRDRHDRGRQN